MENNRKIKIVYFIPFWHGIMMARWAGNVALNIDKEKYQLLFLGTKVDENFRNEISKNVLIKTLDNYHAPTIFFKLVWYFNNEGPDIFISAAPHINIISIMAKIISGAKTKIIFTEHNVFSFLVLDIQNFYKRFVGRFILPRFMRIFYPMADAVVCVSRGVAEDLFKIIKNKNNIEVIYNPVFSDNLYDLAKEQVGHPWFLDSRIPIILAAGRLVKQKDYPTLLLAFKSVIQKKPARLVILGEGIERNKLENFSSEIGASNNVAFLGFVENQYKYMKGASVFVLSSAHEGFGNVIVEAMACGTPVISTDCKSGPNEIIKNGKNGILVPVGDCNALADAILMVLNNSYLAQQLSQEGKKRAEFFLFKTGIKKYEQVFQKILKK